MKLKRNQLLIIVLVAGFLLGIFYVSRLGVKGTIFDPAVAELFHMHQMKDQKYLIFIIKERIGLLFLILFLSNVRFKEIYGGILTFIVGIAGGAVLTMAIFQSGVKGGILCLLCLLPHTIFYGLVYGILVNYWMGNGRWNWSKTWHVIVFVMLGILSEVYINPFFWKIFVW